jgi:uncharacterized protein (UPF0261 family)
MKSILMMGTFDSKGKEFTYLYEELLKRKVRVLTMNTGIFEPTGNFPVHISAAEVSESAAESLESLRRKNDRGYAMGVMCCGARKIVLDLQQSGRIHGVISMGGGGGTSIAASAMQALPIGFPKVCVTTLASGDTSEYVGTKDIVLFPSIVDICGINQFSRKILSRAAGAICGMAEQDPEIPKEEKPMVFLSMFGNSTQCVEQCKDMLEKEYTPMVFHATGGGGKTMESLIREGYCDACLDITTTDWADELCGGILSAGKERLDGPAITGIPHVIVPGCLDMVNFGSFPTVPDSYKKEKRLFYEWNPMVTLMRTNKAENKRLGEILAEKANASKGPTAFVFPLRGLSILDGEGQVFCDWETNEILFQSIEQNLRSDIPVYRVDANINDMKFSEEAVKILKQLIGQATAGERKEQ